MDRDVVLVTNNAGKVRELRRLLGIDIEAVPVSLPEVQSLDVRDVARAKATSAFELLKRPVIVDDSGLAITAWGGLPGALVSWFLDRIGNAGIIRMLQGVEDRSATVVTALGFCSSAGCRVVAGEVSGYIPQTLSGTNGFGYDPIFVPAGQTLTFGEMTDGQKDQLSMRAIAVNELLGMSGVL